MTRRLTLPTLIPLLAAAMLVPSAAQARVKINPRYNGCPIVRKAANVAAGDITNIARREAPRRDLFGATEVKWSCRVYRYERGVAFGYLTATNNPISPGYNVGTLEMAVCQTGGVVTMDLAKPVAGSSLREDYWKLPISSDGTTLEHAMIEGLPSWVYLGNC